MNINALREQRAAKVAEMRSLVTAAETAGRDLAENGRSRFDALKGEAANLEARIGRAESLAEMERHAEAIPVSRHGGEQRLESEFRISRAVADWMDTGKLTGVEAEYDAHHRKKGQRGFSAPVSLFLASGENRASPILTTAPAAGPGGNLITSALGPLVQPLRPALKVQALGATILPGLTENLALPRMTEGGDGAWMPEHGPAPQIDTSFDRVNMSPKTVGCYYELSRRMLGQVPALEGILRADLSFKLAKALDGAAIGATPQPNGPTGVMGTVGVPNLSGRFTTNPVVPAQWLGLTADMIGAVTEANVDGNGAFLANNFTKAAVSKITNQIGEPLGAATVFHNERVEYSGQIPSGLGPNTNLSALLYGVWSNLVIGYWSSVDILLNPFADSITTKGGALLLAFLDADVGVRHPESFVYALDVPNK